MPQTLSTRFNTLMQAGQTAYEHGDWKRAHQMWRYAASIDPFNEKVWIALLQVVGTDEDRRACLENILAINPDNRQAKKQLAQLQHDGRRFAMPPPARSTKIIMPNLLRRAIDAGIIAAILALLLVLLRLLGQ